VAVERLCVPGQGAQYLGRFAGGGALLGITIRAHCGHWGDLLGQQPEQNAEPHEGQCFNETPGLNSRRHLVQDDDLDSVAIIAPP
jgi:hypothetical protein